LESIEDVQGLLEESSQWPHPVVVISRKCMGHALTTLVKNDRENDAISGVAIMAAKNPQDFWANLEDLEALSGAQIADPKAGRDWKKWNPEWFGTIQSLEMRRDSTSVMSFENDETDERILARVKKLQGERDKTEYDHDRDLLNNRIAKLSGGFCVMRVGGVTEMARKERRGRIEDCLGSVQGALRDGVVPGAAQTFLRIREIIEWDDQISLNDDEVKAKNVFLEALLDPLRKLALNAECKPDIVIDRIYEGMPADGNDLLWWGWDAKQRVVRDLSKDPLVADPLIQVLAVVDAAISVSITLMTVEKALTRRSMERGK
jgi:chaperonin GroEL